LVVHTHGELVVHLSWNPGFRTGFYESCVARHTKQSAVWYSIVNQIGWRGLGGLCKCVFGTITGHEKETVEEVCFHTYLKEEIWEEFHCRCQVNFSLETGEKYRRSMFLEDGRMIPFELVDSTSRNC
jgi:hypothetical protein